MSASGPDPRLYKDGNGLNSRLRMLWHNPRWYLWLESPDWFKTGVTVEGIVVDKDTRIAELEAELVDAAKMDKAWRNAVVAGEAEVARLREARDEALEDLRQLRQEYDRVCDQLGSRDILHRAEVASLREALERIAAFALSPSGNYGQIETRKIAREALAGGGQENPVYPRGLDGSDGLEDGHWAVEVGERGERTGATWETCTDVIGTKDRWQ